jgi:hypothetical protein
MYFEQLGDVIWIPERRCWLSRSMILTVNKFLSLKECGTRL